MMKMDGAVELNNERLDRTSNVTNTHIYQSMHIDKLAHSSTGRRQWTANGAWRKMSPKCIQSPAFWHSTVSRWSSRRDATLASRLLCSAHVYLLSSRRLSEQLASLYQAIHSSANRALLQQYEEVVRSLLNQVGENRQQCEQLETSLMRWGRPSVPLTWRLLLTSVKVLVFAKVVYFFRQYD